MVTNVADVIWTSCEVVAEEDLTMEDMVKPVGVIAEDDTAT